MKQLTAAEYHALAAAARADIAALASRLRDWAFVGNPPNELLALANRILTKVQRLDELIVAARETL